VYHIYYITAEVKRSRLTFICQTDLHRMYSLLARIPDGLNPLRSRFELHVKKAGLSAIEKIAEQEGETVVCYIA
jgi:hypothetical protein